MSNPGIWLCVSLYLPFLAFLGVAVAQAVPSIPPPTGKPTTEHRPIEWFKPDERELARHDNPEKTRLMGEDMLANGQLQAVLATEDGLLIAGHGRYLAAMSAGIETLEVKLYPASLTDTQFKLIRAAENLQRKDLNGHQKWLLCADLMCGNADWTQQDLARHLHLHPSTVTQLLSPSKCIPAWQEALKDGLVGTSDCYQASKLDPEGQAGLLALKLSTTDGKRMSRDAIASVARKSKAVGQDAPKANKVKCILPSGVQIVVSGAEVTLDESIDALSEAIKEMKRARDLGYTAKTFVAAMADRARKS